MIGSSVLEVIVQERWLEAMARILEDIHFKRAHGKSVLYRFSIRGNETNRSEKEDKIRNLKACKLRMSRIVRDNGTSEDIRHFNVAHIQRAERDPADLGYVEEQGPKRHE